jgi:hypothetical protein
LPPFRLSNVLRVDFYKRDEITSDLICCDIITRDEVIHAHEEMDHWDELIRKLEHLGGFDVEWFSQISQPAFGPEVCVAFERRGAGSA